MKTIKMPALKSIKSLKTMPKGTVRYIVLAVALILLAQTIFGPKGILTVVRLHQECRRLEQNIASEKAAIDSLKVVEQRLKTDHAYLERAARELLGVSSTGEIVVKFVDPQE